MSARSMTGFAQVRGSIGSLDAIVTLKSVNHRALDIHFHMPPVLDAFEASARTTIKSRMQRGHVQVHVSLERQRSSNGDGAMAIDVLVLERWAHAYREAARILGSKQEPDPNDALRAPGILQAETLPEWSETLGAKLMQCFEEALEELNSFRDREGAAIAEEMRGRVVGIQELAAGMEEIRSTATSIFQTRLKDRLGELLRGTSIDPQRLAQEAAILADRSDISEEVMRLKTHAAQLLSLLSAPGEKGKQLDFLLQEMNRESNTVLSKTSGLGDHGLKLTDLGLAAKAEIDKMREQSLNLE
jgi:uncharacterized protein (TIGR00255 family)